MIFWTILFVIGNILDYLTTYLGMKDVPIEEMKKRELNIFVDSFIHKKKAIIAWKIVFTTLIILIVYRNPELFWFFRVMVIWVFIIVINNLIAWKTRQKKKLSPGKFLIEKLRFPKFLAYFTLMAIYGLSAASIAYLIFQ